MIRRVVLDAAGLDEVATSPRLRALLRRTIDGGGQVWCAAVTIAEVARGTSRTTAVHHALRRDLGGERIRLQPTDTRLALLVGALLHGAGQGSEALADAHVVAVCAPSDVALVVTSDPSDIRALADHLPGVRVHCVRPDLG